MKMIRTVFGLLIFRPEREGSGFVPGKLKTGNRAPEVSLKLEWFLGTHLNLLSVIVATVAKLIVMRFLLL